MKKLTIILLVIFVLIQSNVFAQDETQVLEWKKFNIEFTAGVLNATPVGIQAKSIRDAYKLAEDFNRNFKGALLPKTSAHVGINFTYRLHPSLGLGTGMTYTPKGYWDFTFDESFDIKSKNFTTVDYFEVPLFIKGYFKNNKIALRFGPVFNFTVISKQRNIVTINGEKEKEKYRLGENGTLLPKELVPGIETGLSFGNLNGLHGDFQFQYMGTMFTDSDVRSIVFKVGVAYTISK